MRTGFVAVVVIALTSSNIRAQGQQIESDMQVEGMMELHLPPDLVLPSELELPQELRLPPEFEGTPYWEERYPDFEEVRELEEGQNTIEEFYELFGDLKTADPIGAPQELVETSAFATFSSLCDQGRDYFCRRVAGLRSARDYLVAGATRNADCATAVEDFVGYYRVRNPPATVSRAYDLACLGGLIVRNGEAAMAERPPVLMRAEGEGGLLAAIGLVINSGTPVCAGLLLPDRRFLTAKHCDEYLGSQPAVYQASSGKSWSLIRGSRGESRGVAGDWAQYDIQEADDYEVPPITFTSSDEPTPATVLAGFPYNDVFQSGAGNALAAMRFPRDGLCHTVNFSEGCLQLICQTVGGFSGAPVFRANSSPDSPEVLGIVSGSVGNNTGCNVLPIGSSTLAVSANEIDGASR